MVGFELIRFINNNVSILPEHICKVCQLVMNNPVQCTQCKIWICQSCVEHACNHCDCAHLFTETNKYMKTKIDDLTIRCIFYTNGCNFSGKVNQIEKHEQKCEFKQLICQSKNCIKDSNQSEIKHAKDCGLYIVSCERCNKSMKQMERKAHQCVSYLLEVIESFEKKNQNLIEENLEFKLKNDKTRDEFNQNLSFKEKELAKLTEINKNLLIENENFKDKFQKETIRYDENLNKRVKSLKEDVQSKTEKFSNKAKNQCGNLGNDLRNNLQKLFKTVKSGMDEFKTKVVVETGEIFNINLDSSISKLNESSIKNKC